MDILVSLLAIGVSIAIIWFFAGILLDAVSRMARHFCKTGFITAFFVLGVLTSIGEISVAVNASLAGVPGVSVGNLIGASIVLLLLVVPMLVVFGRPVGVNVRVKKKTLMLMLFAIGLPVVLVVDGNVTVAEGVLAILSYAVLAYSLYHHRKTINACDILEDKKNSSKELYADTISVIVGSLAIFFAAHVLVSQAVTLGEALSVPSSLIGLLALSIGTNIPEIVIAVRSILAKKIDIALGDYLGSASMNTAVFGFLALASGPFTLEASEFIISAVIFLFGLILLYIFSQTRHRLVRFEGVVLLALYIVFVAIQISTIFLVAS